MHMHADLTSTSELPFASLERVLVLKISHENSLIFMQMNAQVTYFQTSSFALRPCFATEAKVNLKLGYPSMSCSGSL